MEFQLNKFLFGNILILAIHKTFTHISHEFKVHDTHFACTTYTPNFETVLT